MNFNLTDSGPERITMIERDTKGRFMKGNRGNPNPVCRFSKGNTAAVKHYGYANGYIRRSYAQFRYLSLRFGELHPDGSEEQLYDFIKEHWIEVIPETNQVYRNLA